MKQTLMDGFSGILDTGWVEDHKMMKGKLIDGKNCEQVQRQTSQDIKDTGSKFDDCSISPKIRQIFGIGIMN